MQSKQNLTLVTATVNNFTLWVPLFWDMMLCHWMHSSACSE